MADVERSEGGSRGPSLARVSAFLVLVVAAELWARRHLGYGLTNPGELGAWIGIASAVVALMNRLFEKGRFEPIFDGLRRASGVLLARPVLVAGWTLFAYFALTRSSVTVLRDQAGAADMRLEALDRGSRSSDPSSSAGLVRFPVTVNPFGSPFRLRAKGFVATSFDVLPLAGRTVRLEEMRRSPSVVVRPSLLALRELENGRIVVWKDTANGREIASSEGPSALLVGPRQALPSSMVEEWKLELESQKITGPPAAATFLAWRRVRFVDPAIDLEPGMTVFARAQTKKGTPIAEGTLTLGPEPIVELVLADLDTSSREPDAESRPSR